MTIWGLSILAAAGLALFVFFAVCLKRFFVVKRKRYTLLSDFPFEIFGDDFARRAMRPLFLFAELLLSSCFLLLLFDARFNAMRSFSIALAAIALVRGAFYFFLFLVPVDHFRLHMALASGSILFSVLLSGMSAIAFKDLAFFGDAGNLFFVLFLILALLSALPVFNPRLKDWARLETIDDGDGTTHMERPKVFPLAFTEWLAFLFHVLASVVFVIGVLVIANLA